ncbi:MAG: hypothetical protein IKT50_00855 [Clostridia bacterium]|nr:hypothetical protein [Clostridia bacterium]
MAIFTNQATLSYQNITVGSNIATGELLDALSATKTALTETYPTTGDITFAVSIIGNGTTSVSGVTVSDDLGAYPFGTGTLTPLSYRDGSVKLFINGVLQAAPAVDTTNGVTFSGFTIPAGGNALLLYEATVTEFASPEENGTITNTVTISANGITTPVTASETVSAATAPNLTINKAISPASLTEGSRVTYTFTIQNLGNTTAVATDNVQVTDLFDPILSDLVVTLNGATLSEGTGYNYNEITGLFTTVPGVITVPAASFEQDPQSGSFTTTPGTAVLTVTGTI